MRMIITIVSATFIGLAVVVATIFHYKVTWPVFKQYLAKKRYRRESVAHPDRVCHNCGGHATRLEAMPFPHKTVYFCKDRKTCEKTVAYQRMLGSMT